MVTDGYHKLAIASLGITTLLGCGEIHRVRIIDRIGESKRFGPVDVSLGTIDSIDHMSGSVVEILGGASIRIDSTHPARDRGANRTELVSHSHPVQTNWVESAGVAVPTDVTSLLFFSAYAHFERAALYFAKLGSMSTATGVPCYYDAHLPISDELTVSTIDNAAYVPMADVFLLMRTKNLEDIPMAVNPGVLAHEYAHRIFYYELWGAKLEGVAVDTPSANRLRAVDEGIADYFAARIVNDPQFMDHSLSRAEAVARDLLVPRHIDVTWLGGEAPTKAGTYDPYPLGTVLAASLWRLAESIDNLDALVLTAQRSLRADLLERDFSYQVGDFEMTLLQQLDGSSRPHACAALEGPYAAIWNRFVGVCP